MGPCTRPHIYIYREMGPGAQNYGGLAISLLHRLCIQTGVGHQCGTNIYIIYIALVLYVYRHSYIVKKRYAKPSAV
jgi:hypothetical protein